MPRWSQSDNRSVCVWREGGGGKGQSVSSSDAKGAIIKGTFERPNSLRLKLYCGKSCLAVGPPSGSVIAQIISIPPSFPPSVLPLFSPSLLSLPPFLLTLRSFLPSVQLSPSCPTCPLLALQVKSWAQLHRLQQQEALIISSA